MKQFSRALSNYIQRSILAAYIYLLSAIMQIAPTFTECSVMGSGWMLIGQCWRAVVKGTPLLLKTLSSSISVSLSRSTEQILFLIENCRRTLRHIPITADWSSKNSITNPKTKQLLSVAFKLVWERLSWQDHKLEARFYCSHQEPFCGD